MPALSISAELSASTDGGHSSIQHEARSAGLSGGSNQPERRVKPRLSLSSGLRTAHRAAPNGGRAGAEEKSATDGQGNKRAKDGKKKSEKTDGQQGGAGGGSLAGVIEQAKKLEGEVAAPVTPAVELLSDPATAAFYLQILEHFSGRSITAADQTAASDGLTAEEVNNIVGFSLLRRSLTDLFTQGLAEFKQAGGTKFEQYQLLIQTLIEQFTRGNPTATLNDLKIGKGSPEVDIIGIADRRSGFLLYDQYGVPLPAFGGGGLMRDQGYIGARDESQIGINIANIGDPALRQLLNSLRQSFGDPTVWLSKLPIFTLRTLNA